MKQKYLLPIVAMGVPLMLFAKPADGRVQTVTNPDGTKIEVALHGDEFFSFYTDATHSRIVELNPKGFWVDAVREGRQLTNCAADLAYLMDEIGVNPETRANGPQRMAALNDEGRSTYNAKDDVPALAILVEYQDIRFTVPNPQQSFHDHLNKEGYNKYGANGSCRDYYIKCSNGMFRPNFDVSSVVTLPEKNQYYVSDGSGSSLDGKYARFEEAIVYAIKALDDEIDFSKYDVDGDGVVDNVYIYYAGYGQADQPSNVEKTIWPHQYQVYKEKLYVDGVQIKTYACSNELQGNLPYGASQPYMDGIGTFCHEYGHVLGLADLYDVSYNTKTETPGSYDLMDNGSYNENATRPPILSAYEKWVCNWLEYSDIEENSTYTFGSVEDTNDAARVRIVRPTSSSQYYPNEYYIFETRGSGHWDQSVPGEGLLVWHVQYNKSAWTSNRVNYNGTERMKILKPLSGGSSYSSDLTFPGPANQTYMTPEYYDDFNPSSNSPMFQLYISGISYDKEACEATFSYNTITELPEIPVVISHYVEKDASARTLTFTWEPAEGAEGYLFTLYRKRATGEKDFYADELNVGNVTSYTTTRLSNAYWTNEIYVSVKAVGEVPSSTSSEEIFLTPSTYESGTYVPTVGIKDIQADAALAIYAEQGCIVAPEGAQVYNINGIQTGTQNLPAGIYVVRYQDQAVKVMVK